MTRTISAADDLTLPFEVVSGLEAIRQRCVQRVRLVLGEWFLAATTGVPWFQSILGQPNLAAISGQIIATEILGVAGVTGVTNITTEIEAVSQRFTFSADVQTEFGETTIATEG